MCALLLQRIGFVSTEDPYVIEQASNMTRIFDGALCCCTARTLVGTEDQTLLTRFERSVYTNSRQKWGRLIFFLGKQSKFTILS